MVFKVLASTAGTRHTRVFRLPVTNTRLQPFSRDCEHVLHNAKILEGEDLAESACEAACSHCALSLGILCSPALQAAQCSEVPELCTAQDRTAAVQQKNKHNSPECLKTEIWPFSSESNGGLANHSPASPPRVQSAQRLALALCNTQAGELSFNPQYVLAPKNHGPARHQKGASCGLEAFKRDL